MNEKDSVLLLYPELYNLAYKKKDYVLLMNSELHNCPICHTLVDEPHINDCLIKKCEEYYLVNVMCFHFIIAIMLTLIIFIVFKKKK